MSQNELFPVDEDESDQDRVDEGRTRPADARHAVFGFKAAVLAGVLVAAVGVGGDLIGSMGGPATTCCDPDQHVITGY
jgi:hypothetical protein